MKILLFFLIFLVKHIGCQWLDPHDMNTNAKEKYMKPSTLKTSSGTLSTKNGDNNIDSEICFSHLKRIISVLINSAHIDKRDPAVYHGNIRFNMKPEDFDFLMSFGKEGLALDKLRKIDTLFSDSFKKSFIHEYLDEIESYQLKLYSVVVNMHNLWILGTVCLLYVVYQLFRNNFSFSYIIKYLIILIFVCDFGFRYQYLLEEAEEHNASIHYSSKCDPAKMTWSEWTKFWLSSKGCERKTVTPLDAFLYQVKNLIIIPMHALGTGMGGFGYNMFTTLPWGLNIVMWPLMLIFVIIVVVFTMVICTGQPIEFNIFHLIKLKFGGTRSVQNENVLTGTTVERLMDRILHRPMVQNINVGVPLGDNGRNQENNGNAIPAVQDNSDNVPSSDEIKSISNEESTAVADTNAQSDKSDDTSVNLSENSSKSSFVSKLQNDPTNETSSDNLKSLSKKGIVMSTDIKTERIKSETSESDVSFSENTSSNYSVKGNTERAAPK